MQNHSICRGMRRWVRLMVALSFVVVTSVNNLSAQDETHSDADRLFVLEVMPVLKQKCLGCHGGDPDDIKGDFSVIDREHLLRGGESGEAGGRTG